MLRTIHLHGSFGKLSDKPIYLDVDNPTMLVLGLQSQVSGFKQMFRQFSQVAFVKGDEKYAEAITPDNFEMSLGNTKDIHIVPFIEGAGFEITWAMVGNWVVSALVNMAVAYVLGSIAQALAPKPNTNGVTPADQKPSFLFTGAVNTNTPGAAVPLVYGRFRVGSVVISAGTISERITEQPTTAIGGKFLTRILQLMKDQFPTLTI